MSVNQAATAMSPYSGANNSCGQLSSSSQYSAAAVNETARQFIAERVRKPSSLPLRQRGDAERLRKPVKIRV